MEEKEIWKDVPNLDGYQVSNLGRIKMLEYTMKMPNGGNKHYKEKIKPQEKTRNGYLRVKCYKDKQTKRYLIHRLVAMAFLDNPNNYPQVNHKDENKENNRADNLEWCTLQYNHDYGTAKQRIARKNTNGKRSKKIVQYSLDGKIINIFPSFGECKRSGYDGGGVWQCCNNKIKQFKGYIWKYGN